MNKEHLMAKLGRDKNSKRALLAALFFVSKRMSTAVPCIFQAWKDHVFERKAGKIHDMLSSHFSNDFSDP